MVEALTGIDDAYDAVDAVVHLAAVPAPGLIPNAATFANNVPSTFHVFQAAKLAGIRKVVWASSETVLGLPFDVPPAYVPVDEAVAEPNSTYSLGKLVEETMAAQFCRWDPDLSMVGLRFSNVMLVEDYAEFAGYTADQRRFNLWSYIDARDAAQAVERALAYEPHGVEVFVIASPDVVPHVPVAQLRATASARSGTPARSPVSTSRPSASTRPARCSATSPSTAGATTSERSRAVASPQPVRVVG